MHKLLLLLFVVGLGVGTAFADPTDLEGGVFIAHYPTAIQFSSDPPQEGWCQHYRDNHAIENCEDQVNRIDSADGVIWFVLAAWEENKEWCGTEFGFGTYTESIFLFFDHGPCYPENGLEIATDNWPGPNEGTAIVVTGDPWAGNLTPVYYFAGYAYSEGIIPLDVDPSTSFGGTANCATPALTWEVAAFGAMGLFTEGTYVCPEGGEGGGGGYGPGGNETAACCLDEDCRITTAEECEEMGGEWLSGESSCDPNPCIAQTDEMIWGTVKVIYR